MGHIYQAVQWNRQKRGYDAVMLGLCLLYLILFVAGQAFFFPNISPETLIIRASGSLAFLLLHIILLIGPLARLQPKLLPLLYNRRHMGVTLFVWGLVHGGFSLIQFHGFSETNPLVSLFMSNTAYQTLPGFPFQILGFFALVILFLMAATSHDFWLKNLSPAVWKGLHMMVYVAYGLLVLHVMLGVAQAPGHFSDYSVGWLGLGMLMVVGAHVRVAWIRLAPRLKGQEPWKKVGPVASIPENRARIVRTDQGEIAVFKYAGKVSAVSNMCKHQNGPLGEGKIIDGCITCPWHGWQYLPEDGCSPPPFEEKVATYRVKIENGVVWVHEVALPEGTPVEPAMI